MDHGGRPFRRPASTIPSDVRKEIRSQVIENQKRLGRSRRGPGMRGSNGALILAGLIAGEMNGANDAECSRIIDNLNKFIQGREARPGGTPQGELAGAFAMNDINNMFGVPLLDKALISIILSD